jgi:hypothetical protein
VLGQKGQAVLGPLGEANPRVEQDPVPPDAVPDGPLDTTLELTGHLGHDIVVVRLRLHLGGAAAGVHEDDRDATRRKQGHGLKIYKAEEPYGGMTLYVFVLDPAVPSADYSITRILAEAYPADVQDLYAKLTGACVAQTFWNTTPVAQDQGIKP